MSTLLVERDGAVGTVTFNVPDKLNAFTPDLLQAAADAVNDLAADEQVRVIAITGAGRGFSAGADLADVGADTLTTLNALIRAIVAAPKAVVALVNGIAAGAGASIAMACDLSVVSDKAAFLLPFNKLGLLPDGGATALLVAGAGRARAMRIALLQEKISAARALEWGLITEVVPADQLAERGREVLQLMATASRGAVRATKQAINASAFDIDEALTREEVQYDLLDHPDFAEGKEAFLAKREPNFG
ncbi:enoyl-CoA hydratase-related protein [Enemella sp. A6]|uniref:enoyl-CoA hydratase-related protein n=1 Tax=Enemella sp. A6 TaxID=3440152 RepID=UPI003EBD6EF6